MIRVFCGDGQISNNVVPVQLAITYGIKSLGGLSTGVPPASHLYWSAYPIWIWIWIWISERAEQR